MAAKNSFKRLDGKDLAFTVREGLMRAAQHQINQFREKPDQAPQLIAEYIPDGERFSDGYRIRQMLVTTMESFKTKVNENSPTKKFCVMTIGRSGSTSFMNCLEAYDDIGVPNKNIACIDNELLHPKRTQGYLNEYEQLSGTAITNPQQMIENFYAFNSHYGYAGFKSMPSFFNRLLSPTDPPPTERKSLRTAFTASFLLRLASYIS